MNMEKYTQLGKQIEDLTYLLRCYLAIGAYKHYRRIEKTISYCMEQRFNIERGLK